MLRAMYSGINGMKNFQVKLDVIGNNISNVNTYGFKKGRVVFKDLVSQTIAGANGPTADGTRGGVNPKQVGLGSQLSAIDTIHTAGSTQTTGRTWDLAISGDGFFQVTDGTNTFYTRSGNFEPDLAGDVKTTDGFYLVSDGGNINIPSEATSVSIGAGGLVTYIVNGELTEAGTIELAKFSNPEGLLKAGGNLYQVSDNSGEPVLGVPGDPATGTGQIAAGALEMSNVDLSEEFTEMIVAQRGFQANTRIITTSDEILQELMSLKR